MESRQRLLSILAGWNAGWIADGDQPHGAICEPVKAAQG
jgi:hypothetical protein